MRDEQKSVERVAAIRAGLAGTDDLWYYRGMAEMRVKALTEDGEMFGLLPHEATELATLKTLLAA